MNNRIFIGNLDTTIEEKHLEKKFSNYGSISSCSLKEKKDIDGNLISKFAYVTFDPDNNSISKCITDLDGTSWKGSDIKVTIAKESFMERLKREREGKSAPVEYAPPYKKKAFDYPPRNIEAPKQFSYDYDNNNQTEKQENTSENGYHNASFQDNKFEQNHLHSSSDNNYEDAVQNNEYDRSNQNFRQGWNDMSQKLPVPSMVRYDPLAVKKTDHTDTKPGPKKPEKVAAIKFKPKVEITKNLFSGSNEVVSLREQFKITNDKDDGDISKVENSCIEEPISTSVLHEAVNQEPPKKFFHISIDNSEEIEKWMCPTEDRTKDFEAVKCKILNMITSQVANAKTKRIAQLKSRQNKPSIKKRVHKYGKKKFKK